jgi:hypothetical protein
VAPREPSFKGFEKEDGPAKAKGNQAHVNE